MIRWRKVSDIRNLHPMSRENGNPPATDWNSYRLIIRDMAIKKSELYSSLWASCDELRGGMDASQYKDYVLVLLFMKYVSDKAASQKGYLLDVLKGDKEIGDKINKIIAKLAEANDLTIIKEADFNDDAKLGKGKEMVDRLTN